ncbi:transcriptional Coactivator p15-domain-containing protein [Amanita rubescens]|nr:transcriptional Coactivator p15-domain-containing protein [Amanita rubescens]
MSTKTARKRQASDNESDFEASDNSQKRDVKPSKSKSGSHNRDSDDAGHGSTPTVKKPRLGKATTSHATSTSSGESYVEIGKKRRVTASVFKGQILVDIREYYGADGDEKPGKKGIALTVEQVRSHASMRVW